MLRLNTFNFKWIERGKPLRKKKDDNQLVGSELFKSALRRKGGSH